MKKRFTSKQLVQEKEYAVPYHYSGLFSEEHALLRDIEYLSYLKLVKKELSFISPNWANVLDVGCGDGRFFFELRNEKFHLVGIDYSISAIRFAQAFNPNAEFFSQDIRQFSYSKKFDAVTLIEVLEHFPPENIPSIFSAIRARMKSHGIFVITVPSVNRKMIEKHYQHFTEKALREVLEPYFNIKKVEGYSKLGEKRRLFSFMRKIAFLLFPFRKRLGIASWFIEETRKYYTKNLEVGKPEECEGLLVVAEPKTR